jgi:hypothetical protein
MGGSIHTEEANTEEAISLYREGVSLSRILAVTGISQASLSYQLEQRGLRPQRRKNGGSGDGTSLSATDLLEQLLAAHREIEKLKLEIEALRSSSGMGPT